MKMLASTRRQIFEGEAICLKARRSLSLLLLLGGLGEEHRVDVGEHTTGGDGHTAKELVQLLVVAHGQLDVTGHDTSLLVIAGSVTGELKDLSGQVLEHGGQVYRGTGTDTVGHLGLLDVAGYAAHRELQTSLCAARLSLSLLGGCTATTCRREGGDGWREFVSR
jgi:hypothetical protein